jgi:hypothetical protein
MTRLITYLFCVGLFPYGGYNHSQLIPKHLVVTVGTPSHQAGEHEYNAGGILLKKWLATQPDMTVTETDP